MGKKIIIVTFLMILVGSVSEKIHAAIPVAERQALIALYNSTNGDNWINNTGWKTEPLGVDGFAEQGSEDSWFGVTLNASETNITHINYNFNNLSGSIPAEIGNLTNLQSLSLYSNQLSDTIPAEIGNITSLQNLSLYNNQLSGNIPAEIGNLTNLQYLFLGSNQLSGSIPVEIGNLTDLYDLRLYNNQLSESITVEIGNLTNLQNLFLNNNQLSGSIPVEIGNLTNLQNLFLDNNQLSDSIPLEVGNLTNLQALSLHNNQLLGNIPMEAGNLTNLQNLSLNNNQLSGNIPVEIMNLTSLKENESDFRWNHLYTENATLRVFLNSKQTGGDWESSQATAVPVIAGIPQASAESAITDAGLEVGNIIMACDGNTPTGNIVNSYPKPGTSVAPASSVHLVISTAPCPDDVILPNVVDMNRASAEPVVISAKLLIGNITTEYDDTIITGNIISSEPGAGSSLAPGSSVNLVVSTGPRPDTVPIPDVVNMTQASAESAITAAGLFVDYIMTAYDDTIPEGNVINSEPDTGVPVVPGSHVNLIISLGPDLRGEYLGSPLTTSDSNSDCFIGSLIGK